MTYTRTFAQLSAAVQTAGGWEGSDDIVPTVLLQAVNYGLLKGYGIMVGKWLDYYTTSVVFSIVAGTDTYALATIAPTFYKMRHLDVSTDGTRYTRCLPHDLEVAHRYSAAPASGISRVRYRMQGASLIFAPVPPAGFGKLYYIPLPPQFASTADVSPVTFDVPEEEMLVVHLAQRDMLIRSDLDVRGVDMQIAEDTAGLRTAADARDAGQPFFLDPNGPPRDYGYGDDDGWP